MPDDVDEQIEDPDEGESSDGDASEPEQSPERPVVRLPDLSYTAAISKMLEPMQANIRAALRVNIPAMEALRAQVIANSIAPGLAEAVRSQMRTAEIAQQFAKSIDTSAIQKMVASMQPMIEAQEAARSVFESIRPVIEAQHLQIAKVFEGLAETVSRLYPENWLGLERLDWLRAEQVCLEEGIPLAGVPRRDTVQALLTAPDLEARRVILARRWKSISTDCEQVLDGVERADLRVDVVFARKALAALRDGHPEAAQALAANLIDSMLRKHFAADYKVITSNRQGKPPLDVEEYAVRVALVVAPVWTAYAEFWTSKGDPIPKTFARHASAHAVSKRQFTRANAVQAAMLASSILWLLERDG